MYVICHPAKDWTMCVCVCVCKWGSQSGLARRGGPAGGRVENCFWKVGGQIGWAAGLGTFLLPSNTHIHTPPGHRRRCVCVCVLMPGLVCVTMAGMWSGNSNANKLSEVFHPYVDSFLAPGFRNNVKFWWTLLFASLVKHTLKTFFEMSAPVVKMLQWKPMHL